MSFAPDPTYQGATGWSAQNPATGVVSGGNLGNLASVAQAVPSGADNRPVSQPQARYGRAACSRSAITTRSVMATMTTQHPSPQRDPALNLGTGAATAESRSGAFTIGATAHALGSDGLAETQARYASLVPREYQRAGVIAMTRNVPSSLAVGLSPSDPRSGTWQGRRYVLSTVNGKSRSTNQAVPVVEQDR
jgi:hypothetical protein